MPDLNPTVAGHLKQIKAVLGGSSAWNIAMPFSDATASSTDTDDSDIDQSIRLIFGHIAGGSSTEIRVLIMSFDSSGINRVPDSATLKIYGKTNTTTGDPTSHSDTNGILGLKTTGMNATDSLATSDWGDIDLSGAGPVVYTDTLTTWNKVGDSTEYNTFTLNSTALSDLATNNTFQIVFVHKFFYTHYDSNPPFTAGNSPDGNDEWDATAGAYVNNIEAYKPVLSYVTFLPGMRVSSGTAIIKSGKLTIK